MDFTVINRLLLFSCCVCLSGCTYIHTKEFTYISVLQKRNIEGLNLKSGDKSMVVGKIISTPDSKSVGAITEGAVRGMKSGL